MFIPNINVNIGWEKNTIMINEKDIELMLSYKHEKEWFEFKSNFINDDELGEYISALSNSAAYYGKKYAYIIWGIDDKSHDIIGSTFDYDKDAEHHEPLKHYLARNIKPSIQFEFSSTNIKNKRVVILEIGAAKVIPTDWCGVRYIRIGSSKEKFQNFLKEKLICFMYFTMVFLQL